jgi:CheY-like chemotaxis protein/anti-sigma regulatory factor (Ser/Thr protein kinase)
LTGAPFSVLVVDDDGDLRTMLRFALRASDVLRVVGEAGDGRTALALAADLQPDVVVLDLGLPDIRGAEVLARLRATVAGVRVVVYTGAAHEERSHALAGGAVGVVSKSEDLQALLRVLGDVVAPAETKQVETSLPNDSSSPGAARRLVTKACREWGCEGVIDAALLVVTELVTNAVVHAGSQCDLRVQLRDGVLRLEVDDEGGGTPDLQRSSDSEEHGRGLFLVSAMSMSWGIGPTPAGKTVWAELLVG